MRSTVLLRALARTQTEKSLKLPIKILDIKDFQEKKNIDMELDSVKLYETVVTTNRGEAKDICQMEERIEKEQNELEWIESTSRLAKFLTTRGLNSVMLLSALKEGNLPKDRLEAHEVFVGKIFQ